MTPTKETLEKTKHINNKTKFSSKAYGVVSSPRVTTSRKVRKGGGRRQIGRPYKIRGKWYYPKEQPGYNKVGNASWYGPNFHGRLTANGEIYDQYALSAAHPTFPLPSYARVTNLKNGRSVVVRVNDRGPYHAGRIIDLSARASKLLDYQKSGVARVRVQYVGQAPLHGRDENYLVASYRGAPLDGGNGSGTLVALADTPKRPVPQKAIDNTAGQAPISPAAPTKTISETGLGPKDVDPFLRDLNAIRQHRDTGSTIALRLSEEELIRMNAAASVSSGASADQSQNARSARVPPAAVQSQ
ncbi:MAG: septal ring lytic transglycosylase RlpA family protein [Pseudomonadota bacterium]